MFNLALVGQGLSRFGHTVLIVGKKYAPQIMTYTGVAGFIATVVYACKATTKAEQILAEKEEKLQNIREVFEDGTDGYSEADRDNDIRIIYVQTRWNLVKTYAPVVTLGLASTALILGGHHIIQMRSASYAAALKASEKAFRAYREAVARKYGENPDRTVLDEQIPGIIERQKEKEQALSVPEEKRNLEEDSTDYAVWNKHTSKYFQDGAPRMNCFFLRKIQDECNDTLRYHGYIFLNEVRKRLGLEYITAGQVVGWILDKHVGGDNYIDFLHLDDPEKQPSQSVKDFFDLKNTDEVVLEFNHDGVIYMDIPNLRTFS